MLLTQEQLDHYDRNGFLVLEDFVDGESCDRLRDRAAKIVAHFDLSGPRACFSKYLKDSAQTTREYIRRSAENISVFMEDDAFDKRGELRQSKELSVMKLGHALHEHDEVFESFSRQGSIQRLVSDLRFEQPQIVQSMYLFKQPNIGAEVGCHQDATFLYTTPISVVGFWFALEEATRMNGCLWVLPGGHLSGLKSRFISTETEDHFEVYDPSSSPLEHFVPLEVAKGALVVMNGQLPHFSRPNRSAKSRHAYTLHVVDGKTHYSKENWLQKNSFRGFSN